MHTFPDTALSVPHTVALSSPQKTPRLREGVGRGGLQGAGRQAEDWKAEGRK